jgi:hypothetical protein
MVAPWISHEDHAKVRASVAHVADFLSELLGTVCEAGGCAASDCDAVVAKLDTVLEKLDAPPPPPGTGQAAGAPGPEGSAVTATARCPRRR